MTQEHLKNAASLRAEIVEVCHLLRQAGAMIGASGNVSARLGDRILITPTGANVQRIKEDDIVVMDFDGKPAGDGVPSSEWAMHAAIYRARDEAHAVVHTHADACTALSCLRRPIPAFHYMVASFGGDDVPCTRYAPFGSQELAELAARALIDRTACLLANHGMICHGHSLVSAADTALKLEQLARQFILASQVGTPVLLGKDEMAEAKRRYGDYGKSRIPESAAMPAAEDRI